MSITGIFGPMYSGKTTYLCKKIQKFKLLNQILIIDIIIIILLHMIKNINLKLIIQLKN